MGEESRIVAQDCGSGTDWTHHAGAGQRPLSTQRRGAGVGGSVGHHPVVPAVVLSQPEPHRTTLEVHEASRPLRSLPPDFPGLSSRHPRGSRRFVNQVLPATGLVDDAEFPAIRRRLTHGRVRYMSRPGTWEETTMASSRCTRLTTPTADPCGDGPSQSATWWAKGCPLRSLPPSFPRRYGSFFKARPTRPGWSHGSIISSARTACRTCTSRSCWPCSTSPATDSSSSTLDILVP